MPVPTHSSSFSIPAFLLCCLGPYKKTRLANVKKSEWSQSSVTFHTHNNGISTWFQNGSIQPKDLKFMYRSTRTANMKSLGKVNSETLHAFQHVKRELLLRATHVKFSLYIYYSYMENLIPKVSNLDQCSSKSIQWTLCIITFHQLQAFRTLLH